MKPGRVVACLDTESVTFEHEGKLSSVAVTFQIGYIGGLDLLENELTENDCTIYRTQSDLYRAFAPIVRDGVKGNYIPVIAVHNLAYDLRYLMAWIGDIATDYDIECCFKSSIKPLNVSICRGREKLLVFWDTLTFSGMSLKRMGEQAGREKEIGKWDYTRSRHSETALDENEVRYAIGDLLTLASWLKYWHELNPDIQTGQLGITILTKTSVVRAKTRAISNTLFKRTPKGRTSIYGEFTGRCKLELPETEADYNLMIRSTSAGWTFTAAFAAGKTFEHVRKRDAESMHPSHMISHKYPIGFQILDGPEKREFVFSTICNTKVEKVLSLWECPFPYAFNARVRFRGLRPRARTVFARDGVYLHGTGLFQDYACRFSDFDDESSNREFNAVNASGYANYTLNPIHAFGKVAYADECVISLNEINAWVHAQVYEWDAAEVLEMSATGQFTLAPDHVFVSVARMLERKKLVKAMLGGADVEKPTWMPESAYKALSLHDGNGNAKGYYGLVKADLNSLYGMFATNEMKQSIAYIEGDNTFDYVGESGFANLPRKPKAWYQFGMRVAAYSRLQQCIAMLLLDRAGVLVSMVNGDTDSLAFEAASGVDEVYIDGALAPLHEAIASSIDFCAKTYHVKRETFSGLGRYTVDCTPEKYCAVANKRYAYIDGDLKIHVASAGVPIRSVTAALKWELDRGEDFSKAVIEVLGYDVEFVGAISGTKARRIPEWGETLGSPHTVIDWRGEPYTYDGGTCVGLALTDTSKVLGHGFEGDYALCCENAGIMIMEPRHYEGIICDDGNVEITGRW